MDGRVMIVCDGFAADFSGEAVPGSYLVSVEPRANGGALVLWSDEPDQAMVFDDLASASEFSRDGPLALFRVSFAPVAGPPATGPRPPEPPPAEPVNLAAELRAMGLI
jgi:hypothetical protein